MGFYPPPVRAWAFSFVPFLADLSLEMIESVQRESALKKQVLVFRRRGLLVTLGSRKTLQLIPSMTGVVTRAVR